MPAGKIKPDLLAGLLLCDSLLSHLDSAFVSRRNCSWVSILAMKPALEASVSQPEGRFWQFQ